MSFDNSRITFDPRKDYFGVAMQQGRVQLDADWNEWLAELARRIQAGTLDILGPAGVPASTPSAFQISATSASTISIGYGRMYVDGILVENHAPQGTAIWDPSMGEWSGSTQIALDYGRQPYYPHPGPPAFTGNGPFLIYLDVWQREVTSLQDPDLVDKAIGIDTTGRYQTVWQVKVLPLPGITGITCSNTAIDPVNQLPQSSALLTNRAGAASISASGPCSIGLATGYTGLENQLYHVEIHQGGIASSNSVTTPIPSGTATCKWSRDNVTVQTLVTAFSSNVLTVQSLGKDQVLGFAAGDWLEVTCDALEMTGQAGELHQIQSLDPIASTITLDKSIVSTSIVSNGQIVAGNHTRIQRWDQRGAVYLSDGTLWVDLNATGSTGAIPVPPSGKALVLENGITVAFDLAVPGGSFLVGDLWKFSARTADGSVQPLASAPSQGIRHHYCRLAIVEFSSSKPVLDCRPRFPSVANPAFHVSDVFIGANRRLSNDGTAAIASLSSGINVVCDLPVSPAILTQPPSQLNSPICYLTVDLPNLIPGAAGSSTFTRTVLAATVGVALNTISLTPSQAAINTLNTFTSGPSLLARLHLKGSAIWAADNPNIYLNGATGPGPDGRACADFEMWFWLTPQPLVTAQPPSLDFEGTVVGTTSPAKTIQIGYTNSGATALTLSTAGDFAAQLLPLATPPNLTIPPGDSTISVTFTPTSTDPAFGQVTISGGTDASLPVIPLTGTGVPVPVLTGPSSSYIVPFGTQTKGSTSTQTITLAGNSSLAISSVAPVATQAGDTPADYSCTLAGGLAIQITFTASDVGTLNASCQINHNAAGSPLVLRLTGAGAPHAIPTVKVTLPTLTNPTTHKPIVGMNFFSNGSLTAQLTNESPSTSVTVNATISGTGFSITSNNCGILAPGATCGITVRYYSAISVGMSGELDVTLSDSSGDAIAPIKIDLESFGTA